MLPTLKRNTNNMQVLHDIAPQGERKSKLSALFNTAHLSRSVETDLDVSKLVNSLSNELYGNAKQVNFIWENYERLQHSSICVGSFRHCKSMSWFTNYQIIEFKHHLSSRTQGSALLYCIAGPLWASSILLNNRQSKTCSDHATILRVRLFYGSVHICNNQRWHQIMKL